MAMEEKLVTREKLMEAREESGRKQQKSNVGEWIGKRVRDSPFRGEKRPRAFLQL